MKHIILVTASIIFGVAWNRYLLKLVPKIISRPIIGIATHGAVKMMDDSPNPNLVIGYAAEDLEGGDLVYFRSDGLVAKAKEDRKMKETDRFYAHE